ncbi:MAG: ParB N-terminal domain-containing protein [Polaribacter sp.]|nr:ParB N-terminal domain-containing protein [Polaribacter sp.]
MSDFIKKTESVKISTLKPHPKNYKNHLEDQLEHIKESINQYGIYKNIVVGKDNVILAGHGLVLACKELDIKEVPVYRVDLDSNDPKALKILTGDNEIGNLALNNDRVLTDLLKEIKDVDDLLGTGFDDMMVANLLVVSRSETEVKDVDEAAEWVGMPEYEHEPVPPKLILIFDTEQERVEFAKKVGYNITDKTTSIRYPFREENDLSSINIK